MPNDSAQFAPCSLLHASPSEGREIDCKMQSQRAEPHARFARQGLEEKTPTARVDLYFGPKPPAGQESNWIYTQAGKKWFPWFRVYGPEKAIFDKTFRLPDIEKVK
jgi:hypothetical protein